MDMASRPKSGITANTDVNLDFLTKEEKEALLSKKMDMIRQQNRLINERHEMIEADRRKAEETGNAVKAMDSKTLPAEGAPSKSKGRGRGQNQGSNKDGSRTKARSKSHGETSYEPIVDVSDFSVRVDNTRSKGKGGQYYQEKDNSSHTPKNRRKPHHKDEGYNAGYARSNRRSDTNPPPDPSFNPLSDHRRGGGSDRKEGFERQDRSEHKRHPRNYGGGADLGKVKDNIKNMREKERDRLGNKPLDIMMTGRERKNHEQWKQERDRYDNERIQRQLTDGGGWRREWDQDKVVIDYDDGAHSKSEPAKRPAGRIGSGRFDRGDSREDRPKTTSRDGGSTQQAQISQNHQQQLQSQNTAMSQYQHAPLTSLQTQQLHNNENSPSKSRPKGRGRGRGRGRGAAGQGGNVGSGGDKSPRPRTWSGGDDRFVECQKEMLVVKFDNTVGDDSVEVEYENGAPLSPTPSSKSSGSTPGRGPTGRTPNQGGSSSETNKNKGGRQNNPKANRNPRAKVGSGRITGQNQQANKQASKHYPDQFDDAEIDISSNPNKHHRHSYPESGSKIRTYSSHSQSQGDSEDWEDCTQSSGFPEDDPALHVDCQLNPDAPEFLPTSPDFLKTPPGHVKVLNWDRNHVPTSPQANLSQPSLTPPSPSPGLEPNVGDGSNSSSVSSPGSSASTRAKNRREEMDMMPEPDEPLPPPFLLEMNGSSKQDDEKEDKKDIGDDGTAAEEDNDKFEDSVDHLAANVTKETSDLKGDEHIEQSKESEPKRVERTEEEPEKVLPVENALKSTTDQVEKPDTEATSVSLKSEDGNSENISESEIKEEQKISSEEVESKKDVNDNDESCKVDESDDLIGSPVSSPKADVQDANSASTQKDVESSNKDQDSQPTAECSTES